MVMVPHLHVTQQYRLPSMAAWFSSTIISHHSLLPHIPLIPSPQSTAAPLWDCSIIPKLQGPRYVWLWQGLSDLIPFRLPQISCLTLSLKCFSSDSDNCLVVGIGSLLQLPCQLRVGPVLLTLLFFPLVPSSYQVPCSPIYHFSLVRYSCPLSAGVLHALL